MKRIALIIGLVFLGVGQVHAEKGEHYYLGNVGYMFKEISESPDPLMVLAFTYGYGINSNWALEMDYMQSISGGGYKTSGTPEAEGEYSLWAFTGNVAYRHLFKEVFYFKGKLGFTYGEDKLTSSLVGDDKKELTALSAAGGVGYLAGDILGSSLTLELMITKPSGDLTGIMVGANATF